MIVGFFFTLALKCLQKHRSLLIVYLSFHFPSTPRKACPYFSDFQSQPRDATSCKTASPVSIPWGCQCALEAEPQSPVTYGNGNLKCVLVILI